MIKALLIFSFALMYTSMYGNEPIKTISYNIRLATSSDKDNQWENRKDEVADFLINQHADFIGIQEALWIQVKFLASKLDQYEFIGVGRDDGQQLGEAMLIFYKKDKWNLVKDKTIWLSQTPEKVSRGWDAACNRTLTQGVFENRNGLKIAIWNTHFDHVGTEARQNSVDLILEQTKNNRDDIPLILMGDFNLTPDTELYQQLSSVLADAAITAESKHTIYAGTYNAFDMNSECERRIDYMFYLGEQLKAMKYDVPAPKTSNELYRSDHFPVITEFEIN